MPGAKILQKTVGCIFFVVFLNESSEMLKTEKFQRIGLYLLRESGKG
jgi:hypothetical protein